MDIECRETQTNLVEMAGEARSLNADGRRHLEHARRAGVDAEVAALACFTVDDDGPSSQHQATNAAPASIAATLVSTCCRRYDGNARSTPTASDGSATRPVAAEDSSF